MPRLPPNLLGKYSYQGDWGSLYNRLWPFESRTGPYGLDLHDFREAGSYALGCSRAHPVR